MRPLPLSSLVALALLPSTACLQPQPAPSGLDDVARFVWSRFQPQGEDLAVSDVELADAAVKVHAAIDGDDLAEPQKGTLTKLTPDEMAAAGLDIDPTRALGMFTASIIHCPIARLREIVVEPDQLSMYPEAYETYERVLDPITEERFQTWTTSYRAADDVPNQYDAVIKAGLRDVPTPADAAGISSETILVRRGNLEGEATFDEGVDAEFTHDFQLETYHERAPGEVVHFYAMWRYMRFGIIDSSSALMMDPTLNGMVEWDRKTDELCAQSE